MTSPGADPHQDRLEAAFRAGHQAGAKGWPLPGALTAWRKARGVEDTAAAPLQSGDVLPYTFKGTRKPRLAMVRVAGNGRARLESYASAGRIRSAWVAASDPELICARDALRGILKPAPGEGGDADPAAPPPLPADLESRN